MKPAAPTNPKTFLDRDNWMRAVNASGEPRGVRCLAFAIALHLNVKEGRCNPGHRTLSKDAGMCERSVRRFAALLESAGWIAVKRGGRGHNSNYVLCSPIRPASNLADQDDQTVLFDRPVPADMTGQFWSHDRPTAGRQKERKAKREKKGKKRASHARAQSSDFASRDRKKEPAAEATKEEKNRAAIDDGFARFWASYPRKKNEVDARAAFGKEIGAGADIERVVARAAVFALERAEAIRNGDLPKWTPYPATWLRKRNYNDPLPDGTVIDETGAIVAIEEPQPQRSGQRGIVAIGEELARASEARGGGFR
jgi:hypothetical protein